MRNRAKRYFLKKQIEERSLFVEKHAHLHKRCIVEGRCTGCGFSKFTTLQWMGRGTADWGRIVEFPYCEVCKTVCYRDDDLIRLAERELS